MTTVRPNRLAPPVAPNLDDRWTDMPCPLCDAAEMWCWIAPGARSSDCACLACGGVVTFHEWAQAQGFGTGELVARAGAPASAGARGVVLS